MDSFKEFCGQHKWTLLCVIVGLVLAILLITIGFWRTLLLFGILLVCFVIGVLMDKNGPDGVKEFFRSLFSKEKK